MKQVKRSLILVILLFRKNFENKKLDQFNELNVTHSARVHYYYVN